jgi:hypothetical protein
MSAIPPEADITPQAFDVRYVPEPEVAYIGSALSS